MPVAKRPRASLCVDGGRCAEAAALNSMIGEHLSDTYFREYQVLRDELIQILTDEDLAVRVAGAGESLGSLCRGIGEVERAYIESFRTFMLDFDVRDRDPYRERSVAAISAWYTELDR